MFEKIKKIFKNINKGFIYIVDKETLIKFLNEQIEFAKNNNLEMIEELNIYFNDSKYLLSLYDYSYSNEENEREKGISVLFENKEYKTVNNLFENGIINGIYLRDIKYFKIELIYGDNINLNKYRENHPELTEEFLNNYNNSI